MTQTRMLALLLLTTFSPYVYGVRLEYVVIPTVFLCFGVRSILLPNQVSKLLLSSFLFLFVPAVITTIFSFFAFSAGQSAPVLNMSLRLFLPAVILGAIALAFKKNKNMLRDASEIIVWMSVPLCLLAFSTVFFDMNWLQDYFVKSNEAGVWSQALAIGRFTGVFNQPLEAGVFYSVALFSLVYLVSLGHCEGWRFWVFFIFILSGGVLSLSKNFIVLGMAITLIYAFSIKLISFLRIALLLFFLFVMLCLLFVFGNENYANSFQELYSEGGLLLALTAGRLGGDTEVNRLWDSLFLLNNWLFGVGLGAYLPLDNGYLEYFYQGGVFALFGYLLFIIGLINLGMRHWSKKEGKLLFFMGVFISLSSLGGPVITANRASISLLVFIAACFLSLENFKNKDVV
jgi:hypothetical protein